jgi:hypothetical protein
MAPPVFRLLVSADCVVPDADALAARLVAKVGVFGHPKWRHADTDSGYVAHFLRVNRNRALAPTVIEPQSHGDRPMPGDPLFTDYMASLLAYLGPRRPMLTHSNVHAVDDIEGLANRLQQRGLPFRFGPISPEHPFDRLWVGCTPEDPRYRPDVDGGLCLEFIPYAALAMPAAPPPEPADLSPGEMIRIVARGWLVRDLDDVLRRLSGNLGLAPAGPVEQRAGHRRARITYEDPASATLDLIAPTDAGSPAGRDLHTLGPGPYYIRIAVKDLAAKAEDLRARGTRFQVVKGWGDAGDDLLRIEPSELGGLVVEMVELTASR